MGTLDSAGIAEMLGPLKPLLESWGLEIFAVVGGYLVVTRLTALVNRIFAVSGWWKALVALVLSFVWSISTLPLPSSIWAGLLVAAIAAGGFELGKQQSKK